MAIAEQDGLIVDLVVGGLSRGEVVTETEEVSLDARRVDAVMRFCKLLDAPPAMEPSKDLVQKTLDRIAGRGQ